MGMFLTLGFYAGLRTSEILRMTWEHIKFDQEIIRIPRPKGISYRGKPRLVEIERKTMRLLRKYSALSNAEKSSFIVPSIWKISQWKKMHLEPLGIWWGNDANNNIMRHTYATMHVAAFRNPSSTALNLGHTDGTRMLEKHYRGLLESRAEAERYWEIECGPIGFQAMPNASTSSPLQAPAVAEHGAMPR